MFQSLSDRLGHTFKKLTGRGRLSEDNIKKALKDVRVALLDADVALSVVKEFIARVRRDALGKEVAKSLNPGQTFIKIIKRELEAILDSGEAALNLKTQPPAVILLAGLQGSGKTTTTGKLAKHLKEHNKKSVLLVSTDVYRPAAIEQLKTLASEIEVDCFPSDPSQKPENIAKEALNHAKKKLYDVLIVDTAGRLAVDQEMMDEVKRLHDIVSPIETLFVVDSLTGQDAAKTAKAFDDALALTGVILTKVDGDARGGAALSIKHITGKPIKFMGMSEKLDGLETFHADRVASRILGMGDIQSLIEEAERKVDKAETERMKAKLKKGKGFDLQDFKTQLEQMSKLGGLGSIMGKIPGMNNVPDAVKDKVNDKTFTQMVAIINSMTHKERHFPDSINGSRKRRIAKGSGTEVQDVNKLLKQFNQMQKMMKKAGKGGANQMMQRMSNMPGMAGAIPPGRFR